MPITKVTYKLISDMKTAGILPDHPHVLELGESNWYGDLPLSLLKNDIAQHAVGTEERAALLASIEDCERKLTAEPPKLEALWELSRLFYKTFLRYETFTTIDLSGSPQALKLDLNETVSLDRCYGMVINFGTAEHVFNVYQLFKTVHEVTSQGGLMVHLLPFQGWVDHGFYTFQPTFYYDLAKTNGYEIIMIVCVNQTLGKLIPIASHDQVAGMVERHKLEGNNSLVAIFRKSADSEFRTPMQGYYADSVSESVHEAWHKDR